MADSAGAGNGLMGRGPQLFTLDGVPAPGKTTEQVEAALREQVARIARDGVSEAELNRVKTQWVASEVYKLDSVMNQARELGSNWAQGLPLDAGEQLIARLRKVTAAQVQAVAAKYFGDDQLTVATLRAPAPEPRPQAAHPAGRRSPLTGAAHDYSEKDSCERPSDAGLCPVFPEFCLCRHSDPALDPAQRRAGLAGRKPGHSDGGRADRLRRRRPARPGGPGRAGQRHGRHGRPRAWQRGAARPALDENQLGEAWADLGASFGASAGSDRMSFSLRSLSYPDLLERAAALAARQIGEPSFPEPIWQRERERLAAAIREANTRPATVAGRAFSKGVYGDHPYGYEMTEATLARIDVADMRSAVRAADRSLAAPRSASSARSTGRRPTRWSRNCCRRLPAGDAAACAPLPAVPEVAPLTASQERRIPFDSAQAHVLIGQPGYKRDDPDFFALLVGNYILGGGGFVSRLTTEVREKRGLSYSVYSYFSPGLHAGAFTIGLQTRPDQAEQALKVSREVVAQFVAEGPTPAELKAAKDNLIGGFALRIDSNRKLLDNVANIAWNNLPLDYLDTWTQQVEKVTAADIRAAFARKLQPERMVTVVVGGAT